MRNEAGPPICYNCSRKRPAAEKRPFSCDAFPNGIPKEIIHNQADHRNEFPGDNGLRYDAISDDWEMPLFGPGPGPRVTV